MPRTRSAKKNLRKTSKRTLRNRWRKERLKKVLRDFQASLASKDASRISTSLTAAQRALDKAGSKGLLHRNTVARRKARLALAANKAKARISA